jgi:hypothetical protein
MKTRPTFLTIAPLTLGLALLALTPAPAEANDPAKAPAAAGPGRQAIVDKLEHIRLETVSYDGLPLSEVIINLRDQAKKRDPEKKGINFILNQNLGMGEANPASLPTVPANGTLAPAPPRGGNRCGSDRGQNPASA